MMRVSELKLEDFMAWLQQQPPARAFRRRSACQCPLAAWVGAVVPGANGVNRTYVRVHSAIVEAPHWFRDFVGAVDRGNGRLLSAHEAYGIAQGLVAT